MGFSEFMLTIEGKKPFRGIGAGDTVWYKDRDGKTKKAKVNPLLIFSDHVMVNAGTFGTYVDESNYVRHGIYV